MIEWLQTQAGEAGSVMATALEVNRQIAEKLYAEARQDPTSLFSGKKVGLANGKVVAVADDWNDVVRVLEQVEPDASRTYCIDMAQDYATTQYIWGFR
jgi:hypothetical protein